MTRQFYLQHWLCKAVSRHDMPALGGFSTHCTASSPSANLWGDYTICAKPLNPREAGKRVEIPAHALLCGCTTKNNHLRTSRISENIKKPKENQVLSQIYLNVFSLPWKPTFSWKHVCKGILKIFEKCRYLCFLNIVKGNQSMWMRGGGEYSVATPASLGHNEVNFIG